MLEKVYGMLSEAKENMYDAAFSCLQERSIILYGAGGIGYITSTILKDKGCKVSCFVDDAPSKQGTCVNGIKVVPLESISPGDDFTILICLPNPMDVYHRLISSGFQDVQYLPVMSYERGYYDIALIKKSKEAIDSAYSLLKDDFSQTVFCNLLKHRITMDFSYLDSIISAKQYFPKDIFTLSHKECFVDGGAYHGETIWDFVSMTNGRFKYIYGFEPDSQNFLTLKKNIGRLDPKCVQLFNAGLYSKTGKIAFDSRGNSGSSISETGNTEISLMKLDEVIGRYKPTYIKLDIEGAEEEALRGMENTIVRHKPKLAISVYHKAADLWELPLMIHHTNPSYKIHLRHYTNGLNETVCYAL